jgi:7-cyano-7-deazaguanine synthase in queuosine biosynthesis
MRTMVLLSGGIDSTVTLANCLNIRGNNCIALTFNMNRFEIHAAKNLATYYNVHLRHKDFIGDVCNLREVNEDALSQIIGVAQTENVSELWIGSNTSNMKFSRYLDLAKLVIRVSEGTVYLVAPYVRWSKWRLVQHGLDMVVPYHLTRSCDALTVEPCGHCFSCLEREESFKELGLVDPTLFGVA